MKVLVTYFTQTGNTEQIAKAISDEVAKAHEAELKKLEDVQPESLKDYDVVFLGTPIHAGNVSAPANDFLGQLPQSGGFKLAGFVTHSAPSYSSLDFDSGMASIQANAREKDIQYLGGFECQGRLNPALHPMVKQVKNVSEEEFQSMMAEANKCGW